MTKIEVGDVLADKYRVERVLGRGGMGMVVAATHLQLGEKVAIKFLLNDEVTNQKYLARFLREGRIAARIRSEHIARVFDVGQIEDGAPYLVMEYLEGRDVHAKITKDGPLSPQRAAAYLLQACDAVGSAHALGIIHRDIKPSNLFLAKQQDGTAMVKVIDFGISKIALTDDQGADENEDPLTRSTTLVGSPHYMAPEQMQSSRDVDWRADVWALGGTLHTMLTGKLPFKGKTILAVCENILKGVTPLRQLRPETPELLEQIILRCLRREKDERYADVAELASALAPLAPSHLRHYAPRIGRVLKLKVGPDSSSLANETLDYEDEPEGGGLGIAPTEAEKAASPTNDSAHDSSVRVASVAGTEQSADETATASELEDVEDRTAGPATRELVVPETRSRSWMLALAAAVLVVGGTAWWFGTKPANRTDPGSATTDGAAESAAQAAALPGTEMESQLERPQAAADAGLDASGSLPEGTASATSSGQAVVPQVKRPPRPRPRPPTVKTPRTAPAAKTNTKSGDLWDHPH